MPNGWMLSQNFVNIDIFCRNLNYNVMMISFFNGDVMRKYSGSMCPE